MGVKNETLNVRGHDLHVLHSGDGEALLYLHGYDDAGIWTRPLDELSQFYHVYAPEHPGFGDSPRLEWIETVDDMVFYYIDLLDSLQIDKVHVIGSSLGGWIAAEIATRHPERLNSLTLVNSFGIRVKGNLGADIFALNQESLKPLKYYNPELAPVLSQEEEEKLIYNRRMLAQLAWEPRLFNPKLEERLVRIHIPTLVVWGREDKVAPLVIGEKYANLIPGAELRVIEECGHVPTIERPADLVHIVRNHLLQLVKEEV
jgi:pimeloyl-ACP methyl ester carboxylesterase